MTEAVLLWQRRVRPPPSQLPQGGSIGRALRVLRAVALHWTDDFTKAADGSPLLELTGEEMKRRDFFGIAAGALAGAISFSRQGGAEPVSHNTNESAMKPGRLHENFNSNWFFRANLMVAVSWVHGNGTPRWVPRLNRHFEGPTCQNMMTPGGSRSISHIPGTPMMAVMKFLVIFEGSAGTGNISSWTRV